MIVKEIEFNQDRLMSGVRKIAKAVKSTLGPMGQTVLIESENHTRGIVVTKDGVTVAKSIVLDDPIENLAVTMMKEASEKTANSSGDGTSTALVLAEAIIDAYTAEGIEKDPSVLRDIVAVSKEIIKDLSDMAVPVTNDSLLDVATISANNDKEIGEIVADAYIKVGKDGAVTVENSSTSMTYSEVVNGMRIKRGYSSKYMVTDEKRQEAVLENPYILISDQEISSLQSIEHILAEVHRQNRSILIISEMGENALNSLNLNKMKGVLKVAVILPPQFGYKKQDLMSDLAIATGGKYITDDTGDDFSLMTINDLGQANKVVVGKDASVVILKDSASAKARIEEIKGMTTDDVAFREERIANLAGGVAVIYVGASSDIEQKEKKDRVDDAVCATKAALEEGILPGGGYALLSIVEKMWSKDKHSVARKIMAAAIVAPFYIILENAGINPDSADIIRENFMQTNLGYNVKTAAVGDLKEMGVIDPSKVTKNALENAVSVSTTILGTNCTIYNMRAK
jgi:chaperonin GroEL